MHLCYCHASVRRLCVQLCPTTEGPRFLLDAPLRAYFPGTRPKQWLQTSGIASCIFSLSPGIFEAISSTTREFKELTRTESACWLLLGGLILYCLSGVLVGSTPTIFGIVSSKRVLSLEHTWYKAINVWICVHRSFFACKKTRGTSRFLYKKFALLVASLQFSRGKVTKVGITHTRPTCKIRTHTCTSISSWSIL